MILQINYMSYIAPLILLIYYFTFACTLSGSLRLLRMSGYLASAVASRWLLIHFDWMPYCDCGHCFVIKRTRENEFLIEMRILGGFREACCFVSTIFLLVIYWTFGAGLVECSLLVGRVCFLFCFTWSIDVVVATRNFQPVLLSTPHSVVSHPPAVLLKW